MESSLTEACRAISERHQDMREIQCFLCKEAVQRALLLPEHFEKSHSITLPDFGSVFNLQGWTNVLLELVGPKLKCPVCQFECGTLQLLLQHVMRVDPLAFHTCHVWSHQTIPQLQPFVLRPAALDLDDDEEQEEVEDDGDEDAGPPEFSSTQCLYCTTASTDPATHFQTIHGLDFAEVLRSAKCTSDYDRIKIVNYVRHQISQSKCPQCNSSFPDVAHVYQHIEEQRHFGPLAVPDSDDWLLPRVPNDGMLQFALFVGAAEDPPDQDYPMVATLLEVAEQRERQNEEPVVQGQLGEQ